MREITQELLEKLLSDYDPDVDLSEGSPAFVAVIDPLLRRLEPDPLSVPFAEFAQTLLADRFPDLSFADGDALSEAVAKPMEALTRPLVDQMAVFLHSGSFAHWRSMSSPELEDLAGNFFITRNAGGFATGPVRLYFPNPVAQQIGTGNIWSTARGLRFTPVYPQSIAADVMLTNKDGNLYYMDVQVIAEAPGLAYNVDVGEVVSVVGVFSAVKTTNLRKFSGGVRVDDDAQLVESARAAVAERSLTADNGIITRLLEELATLKHVRVVGHGDDEMVRDVLSGGGLGEVIDWAVDGHTVDDGDGDDQTQYLRADTANFVADVGPVGPVGAGHVLTFDGADLLIVEVFSPTLVGVSSEIGYLPTLSAVHVGVGLVGAGTDIFSDSGGVDFVLTTHVVAGMSMTIDVGADAGTYRIIEVAPTGVNTLRLATTLSGASSAYTVHHGYGWQLRKSEITLSSIPGGFALADKAVADDHVHVGGMVDIYVSGELDELTTDLTAVADQLPVVRGNDLFRPTGPTPEVSSTTVDFDDAGVVVGDYLVIVDGLSAGTYLILGVTGHTLWVDGEFAAAFAGVIFYVTSQLDVELTDPAEIKYEGTDLAVAITANVVTTGAGTDFAAVGTMVGDYLRVVGGPDAGDWQIDDIVGVGHSILQVDHNFSTSQSGLAFAVLRKQTPVELPVVSVDDVELLDVNGEPMGVYVPYAQPVDCRPIGPFTNLGVTGQVLTIDGVTLGIVGDVDLAGGVIFGGPETFVVEADAVYCLINFAAGVYTADQIVAAINAVVADVAFIRSDGALRFLVLQSVNRHLVVGGGTANATLGVVVGWSNDRMAKAGVDWTAEGLTTRSIVHVVNGPAGYYKVYYVGGVGNECALAVKLFTPTRFWTSDVQDITAGNPSVGVARVYFKDPTYFAVTGPRTSTVGVRNIPWGYDLTKFTAVDDDGATTLFYPDQAMDGLIIPTGDGPLPNNGMAFTGGGSFYSQVAGGDVIDGRNTRIHFLRWDIRVGDVLTITTCPIVGTVDLAAGIPGLPTETLTLTIADVPMAVTFDAGDTTVDAAVDAINVQTGEQIAAKDIDGAAQYLIIESDLSVEITGGTSLPTLGLSAPSDNAHVDAGEYRVSSVGTLGDVNRINVRHMDGTAVVFTAVLAGQYNVHFTIHRQGLQKFNPTTMAAQMENGLYYVDVELASYGQGNAWNIAAGRRMTVADFHSFGWWLTTANVATCYSMAERLWMHLTTHFIPVDQQFDPDQLYYLGGQNIQIGYKHGPIVDEAQAYVDLGDVRNCLQNPLVKHLLPAYIYLSLTYQGGSAAATVVEDLETLIDSIRPAVPLTVYDLSTTIRRRQAESMTNPVELVALTWEADRSAKVTRSENELDLGGRYALYVGLLTVSRV